MGTKIAIHVVKIGGSLLTRTDFVPALRRWINDECTANPASHLVLLVGGGALVDVLRGLDELRPIDPVLAHWSAIELMEITGELVHNWIPEWPIERSLQGVLARCTDPGVTLFLSRNFLREFEPQVPGPTLPAGWQVTSDSIAARVAEAIGAERLTLLKSQRPPQGGWQELASLGYVDEHFPLAIASLGKVVAQELLFPASPPPPSHPATSGSP